MPAPGTVNRLLATLTSLVFLVLTIVSSFSVQLSNSAHLPISLVHKILTLAIPILQLVFSLQLALGCHTPNLLTQHPHSTSKRPSQFWSTLAVSLPWLISLLDTVLISTASFALDPQTMDCSLDSTWRHWFRQKQAGPIRSIQDRFECCGFHSVVDNAWPFQDKSHGVDACSKMHDRALPCDGAWQRSTRGVLITCIAVGVTSLVLKVLAAFVFSGARGEAWNTHQYGSRNRRGDPARQALLTGDVRSDAPLLGDNDVVSSTDRRYD